MKNLFLFILAATIIFNPLGAFGDDNFDDSRFYKFTESNYDQKTSQKHHDSYYDDGNVMLFGLPFNVYWSLGSIGYLGNTYSGSNRIAAMNIRLLDLYLETPNNLFLMRFNPFESTSFDKHIDGRKIFRRKNSLLNLDFLYNPFKKALDPDKKRRFIAGPFASVNYLAMNEDGLKIEMDDAAFSAGIRLSLFSQNNELNYFSNWLSIETGYRYMDDKNMYYFKVNTDIAVAGYLLGFLFWQLIKESIGLNNNDDDD